MGSFSHAWCFFRRWCKYGQFGEDVQDEYKLWECEELRKQEEPPLPRKVFGVDMSSCFIQGEQRSKERVAFIREFTWISQTSAVK